MYDFYSLYKYYYIKKKYEERDIIKINKKRGIQN